MQTTYTAGFGLFSYFQKYIFSKTLLTASVLPGCNDIKGIGGSDGSLPECSELRHLQLVRAVLHCYCPVQTGREDYSKPSRKMKDGYARYSTRAISLASPRPSSSPSTVGRTITQSEYVMIKRTIVQTKAANSEQKKSFPSLFRVPPAEFIVTPHLRAIKIVGGTAPAGRSRILAARAPGVAPRQSSGHHACLRARGLGYAYKLQGAKHHTCAGH